MKKASVSAKAALEECKIKELHNKKIKPSFYTKNHRNNFFANHALQFKSFLDAMS